MKSKMNFKTMKKSSKDAFITYAMVVIVYLIIQAMVMSGSMSSLMQGMLVPLCTYSIVAIGLNLCVGYLGELSLGHAGFMCVGAFSSAFFTRCMEDSSMNPTLYHRTADWNRGGSIFWIFDRNSGASSAW